MSFDPVTMRTSRRSLLRNAAIVGAGITAASLLGSLSAPPARAAAGVHPGLLHTNAGLAAMRARTSATTAPWASGWNAMQANARSQAGWSASPVATLNIGGAGENYDRLLDDAHAAYQNALMWKLTDDTAHAETARDILNAWSQTLTSVSGTPLIGQTAGIYGFVLANAAELVRDYPGFDAARFATMLSSVLYPVSDAYLTEGSDPCRPSYETNWRLSHVASVLAIGIFADDDATVDQATAVLTDTPEIMHSIPYAWDGGGSDRYSITGLSLLAVICELAWNQNRDLYGSHGDRLLVASEEAARFELDLAEGAPVLGVWGTSATSPASVLIHDHYVTRMGLSAPDTAVLADRARAEGGGFDHLGFGALAYSL